jgi:hypothetical protein
VARIREGADENWQANGKHGESWWTAFELSAAEPRRQVRLQMAAIARQQPVAGLRHCQATSVASLGERQIRQAALPAVEPRLITLRGSSRVSQESPVCRNRDSRVVLPVPWEITVGSLLDAQSYRVSRWTHETLNRAGERLALAATTDAPFSILRTHLGQLSCARACAGQLVAAVRASHPCPPHPGGYADNGLGMATLQNSAAAAWLPASAPAAAVRGGRAGGDGGLGPAWCVTNMPAPACATRTEAQGDVGGGVCGHTDDCQVLGASPVDVAVASSDRTDIRARDS